MGSIVARCLRTGSPGTDLATALAAGPARSRDNSQSASAGQWRLAVSGQDSWLAWSGPYLGAVTGTIDDAPAGSNPATFAIEAINDKSRIKSMRGVFSAVVTNGSQAWAWRDHLGFSPLFTAGEPVEAIASSAIQALAAAEVSLVPNLDMIHSVFWGSPIHEDDCYFLGARRIPKASVWTSKDGDKTERYWAPDEFLESRSSRAGAREEFLVLMTKATERALGTEPVVALSGGIDAPAVAGFAAPIYERRTGLPLPALSSIYPRWPTVDESKYIEIVARANGMDLHTFEPSAGPLEDIESLVRAAEAPPPTVSLAESAEYYRLARDMGFRTILTGEMAEFTMAMGGETLRHLVRTRRLGAASRYLAAERARGVSGKRLAKQAARALVSEDFIRARRHRRGQLPQQTVSWLKTGESSSTRSESSWRRQQVSAFVGPGLSVEADEAIQELCGVRVRRPWLDVDLWEFFLSLPADLKYPNGHYKALAREWLRGYVPDEILDRRDRTYFEESFFGRLDFTALRALVDNGAFEMPGVNYTRLRERLDEGSMPLVETMWAKDLAVVHAFMKVFG